MSALYNEYLTGAEREAAIIIAESDARFAKLDLLLETVDGTLNANMLAAEAKVFAENGTYDDLTMLYKEASDEAEKKKGGIFAAIFGAIRKFFASIGQFFTKHFGDKEIPAEAEMPSDVEEHMNIFQRIWNQLKSAIDAFKNGDVKGGCQKIVGLFSVDKLGLPAVFGSAAAVVIIKREKIKGWLATLRNASKDVEDATAAAQEKIDNGTAVVDTAVAVTSAVAGDETAKKAEGLGEKVKGALTKAKEILTKIGRWIMNALARIKNWIKGKFTRDTEDADENETPVEEPKKDETPAEEPKKADKKDNKTNKNTETDDELSPKTGNIIKKRNPKLPSKADVKKYFNKQELADITSGLLKDNKKLTQKLIDDALDAEWLKRHQGRNKSGAFTNMGDVDEFNESVSLFGVTLDSDELFLESGMAEEQYKELCELFADL